MTPELSVSLRRRAAEALEQGRLGSGLALALSAVWRRLAEPERVARLPEGARVVGIGGATLGGAGKTPVVLALARALAARGTPVAVAATGYGGRTRAAQRVAPHERVECVGDEALWLARELAPLGVPVVAGRRRSEVLALAARAVPGERVPIVICDALLQTRPERLALSVLVVDAGSPWGAGRNPPAGDLRACRARLIEAADVVLAVHSPRPGGLPAASCLPDLGRPVLDAAARLGDVITPDGRRLPLSAVAALELGVVLAIARPERVLASLAAYGLRVARAELVADHAAPRMPLGRIGATRQARAPVDVWLTTPKCATKLDEKRLGAPVWVLGHEVELPQALVDRVAALRECRTARIPKNPW